MEAGQLSEVGCANIAVGSKSMACQAAMDRQRAPELCFTCFFLFPGRPTALSLACNEKLGVHWTGG